MRSFFVACMLAALTALGAAYVLDNYLQQSAQEAFSTQGTRLYSERPRRQSALVARVLRVSSRASRGYPGASYSLLGVTLLG
jgi:hypothetical protein